MPLRTDVITVKGINSGACIEIDLVTLNNVFEWYIRDVQRDQRSINNIGNVIRLHDTITGLVQAECEFNEKYMSESALGEEAKKILNGSIDLTDSITD